MQKFEALTPYTLTFEHRPHYLYANVKGEHDNYRISCMYWEEIARELDRTGYKKLLVYEELRATATRSDAFRSICSFGKDDFEGVQIAFVDRYPEHSDVNDFAVQACRNKGFDLENFPSIEIAERWLTPYDFAA